MPLRRIAPRWIFAGLGVGVVSGMSANLLLGATHPVLQWVMSHVAEPCGQLFLRLLLMLVVPLVFSSLVLGVAGLGEIGRLGRVGIRSLVYCLVISVIAVGLALGMANVIRPGQRVAPETRVSLQERYAADANRQIAQAKEGLAAESPLLQMVKTMVPRNPVAALASEPPNMLHLMFFALFIGVGMLLLPEDRTAGFRAALEGLYAITARLIDLVMWLAPVAVACLVFQNLALFGLELLGALGWFMVAVLGGLSLHQFVVYPVLLRWLSRVSPWEFFRRIRVVMLTAFSTSSSNATLPTTLQVAEEQLGIPRQVGSFVLTVGATANQNGTALYEGVTVLFLAQLAGVDLTLTQQALVAYLAVLGSIGTAGVPSGSIPFIVLILPTLGINPALIALILGVDRLLDMCRTVVNVTGDLAAATYVARMEPQGNPKSETRNPNEIRSRSSNP